MKRQVPTHDAQMSGETHYSGCKKRENTSKQNLERHFLILCVPSSSSSIHTQNELHLLFISLILSAQGELGLPGPFGVPGLIVSPVHWTDFFFFFNWIICDL